MIGNPTVNPNAREASKSPFDAADRRPIGALPMTRWRRNAIAEPLKGPPCTSVTKCEKLTKPREEAGRATLYAKFAMKCYTAAIEVIK